MSQAALALKIPKGAVVQPGAVLEITDHQLLDGMRTVVGIEGDRSPTRLVMNAW